MSWTDRFKEGSFRGAPFLIEEAPSTFGRRNQVHEYPQRDTPWTEDLGRAARRWSIECIVIGADYDVARDALIAAMEAKGPGTLIHPYLGTVTACLETPGTVTDSTSHGGMARFSLAFVEAGMDTVPASTPDTQAKATAAAAALKTASAASAVKKLSILGQAANVVASAQHVLAQVKARISSALAGVQAVATGLTAVEQGVQGLVTGSLGLLQAPAALVDQVFTAVAGVGNLATYAEDALGQLFGPLGGSSTGAPPAGLLGFGSSLAPVLGSTPSQLTTAENQLVLGQVVAVAAAAAAVTVVAEMDFTSYDDAVSIRDPLAAALDDLAVSIADGGDDDLARAVDDLRLAMVADVTARGASLARLYKYTPATTEPAVVIAQRLYGDGSRADDIIARNPAIQNPGFVAGGVAIEVLTDA
jgi:prophage DNA circulation protein